MLDGVAECCYRVRVRFALDLLQHLDRFGFGLPHDGEPVDGEADLVLAAELAGALAHVGDLLLEPLERVAVHEVVVRDVGAVLAGVDGVAALEDQRVRASGEVERLGR